MGKLKFDKEYATQYPKEMKLLNISNHHIGDCCKDRNKTAGGYHWMYYEDYLNIK